MARTLDLRGDPRERRRDRLFDHLDGADPDETVAVTADCDLTAALGQYRVERDAATAWECERRDGGDWRFRVPRPADANPPEYPPFDVRELPPARRHAALTGTFDRLDPGEGFVLVNDHDPKPLFYELRSTHGDVVGWEYRDRGADGWRVEVVKTAPGEAAAADSADGATTAGDAGSGPAAGDDVTARFDVRDIPKADRHPTIHHRFGNLRAGETMAVVAPHEPRPLKGEFERRYGDAFEWTVRESEPGRCLVHVRKTPNGVDDEGSLAVTSELDVRTLVPAERHELIFESYEELSPGEAFVLVNDHDPKPLRHQFAAEAGDAFDWEYRQRDPGEFRVRIGKRETGRDDDGATGGSDDPGAVDDAAPF